MTLHQKIRRYSSFFEAKYRADKTGFLALRDDAPEELHNSVFAAHGDKLPEDWTYQTYNDILEKLDEYEIKTRAALDDSRGEIVESLVDVYTACLTAWLAGNLHNVAYLSRALEEGEPKEGSAALSLAQYYAIDDIYGEIVKLLDSTI